MPIHNVQATTHQGHKNPLCRTLHTALHIPTESCLDALRRSAHIAWPTPALPPTWPNISLNPLSSAILSCFALISAFRLCMSTSPLRFPLLFTALKPDAFALALAAASEVGRSGVRAPGALGPLPRFGEVMELCPTGAGEGCGLGMLKFEAKRFLFPRDEPWPNGLEVEMLGGGGTGGGRVILGLTVACIRARDDAVGL